MKRLVLAAALGLILFSCKKEDVISNKASENQQSYLLSVQANLKDSLSKSNYDTLDFSNYLVSTIDSLHVKFARISVRGQSLSNNFFIVKTNNAGQILAGRFVSVVKDSSQQTTFTGNVTYRSMGGTYVKAVSVVKQAIGKFNACFAVLSISFAKFIARYF